MAKAGTKFDLRRGYLWDDPRDIIDIFERKIADFCGSKFCVLTDSATSGIFLSLKLRNIKGKISIPNQTYASVAFQILHSGAQLVLEDREWSGLYELIGANIFDSAARFGPNIYIGDNSLQVLSFQIKKRLPIGRGGAILTDSKPAYEWLKLASYDGRDLKSKYDSKTHISQIGWHCYMTPEDAARGILLMDQLPKDYSDTMDWRNYPPISDFEYFSNLGF